MGFFAGIALATRIVTKIAIKLLRSLTKNWRESLSWRNFFSLLESESDFRDYLKMSVAVFFMLLDKIKPYIGIETTRMRDPIPLGARLEATILFLTSGPSGVDKGGAPSSPPPLCLKF